MESAEVRGLIEAGLPGCQLTVDGEACNFSVVVVAEAFEGLSPVKRQQKVLETVRAPLATGALHAISMKVYTPSEWRREQEKAGAENTPAPTA